MTLEEQRKRGRKPLPLKRGSRMEKTDEKGKMKEKLNCPAVLSSSLGFFQVLFMLPFSILQKNCFPPLYPKLAS